MSRRKKAKREVDTDSWINTYADTITLLLTFFVMLYAFSNVDAERFKSVAVALQSVLTGTSETETILNFGDAAGEIPVVGNPDQLNNHDIKPGENIEQTIEGLKGYIEENGMKDYIDIKEDSRGYIFEIKDKILFESAKADLRIESYPVLQVLVKYLETINNDIIVEGHTDNIPINNERYIDNYSLSADRANNVARYFINKCNISPTRVRPTGLGEYFPLVENNNAENRAKNRRVNVLIVTETSKKE